MNKILIILLAASFSFCTNNANKVHEIERVIVVYDNGSVLRIVQPKANDIVRWSVSPAKHNLELRAISDNDSLDIFYRLLKSVEVDSLSYIATVTVPIIKELDSLLTVKYYDDIDDVNADVMVVYEYKGRLKEADSLFFNYRKRPEFRINNHKCHIDTTICNKIYNLLLDSRI